MNNKIYNNKILLKDNNRQTYYIKNNNINIDLIDLISTVIKIGLISKKDIGTKISIQKNNIYIQDNSYYQCIIRWYNGDKRLDMYKLYYPILLLCKYYVELKNINTNINKNDNIKYDNIDDILFYIDIFEFDDNNNLIINDNLIIKINVIIKFIIYIFEKCKLGLNTLLNTYNNYITIYNAIDHLITLIDITINDGNIFYNNINNLSRNYLNNDISYNILDNNILSDNKFNNINITSNNHINYYNSIKFYNKILYNMWNYEDINVIYQLLKKLYNNDNIYNTNLHNIINDNIYKYNNYLIDSVMCYLSSFDDKWYNNIINFINNKNINVIDI